MCSTPKNLKVFLGDFYRNLYRQSSAEKKTDGNVLQDYVTKIMQNAICIELLSITAEFDTGISTGEVSARESVTANNHLTFNHCQEIILIFRNLGFLWYCPLHDKSD